MRRQPGDEQDAALALHPQGLRGLARVAGMKRSELLFRRGDAADAVFRVLKAEVRLARCSASGVETVMISRSCDHPCCGKRAVLRPDRNQQ